MAQSEKLVKKMESPIKLMEGVKMKKFFHALKYIQIIMALAMVILAIYVFIKDSSDWSLQILFILLAMNLFITGIQEIGKNKRSVPAYCVVVMALLILFLSL